MSLKRKFINDVVGGRDLYTILAKTTTGTGLASGNKLGMCVLDSSSGDWFLCTASTDSGTWVKIVP